MPRLVLPGRAPADGRSGAPRGPDDAGRVPIVVQESQRRGVRPRRGRRGASLVRLERRADPASDHRQRRPGGRLHYRLAVARDCGDERVLSSTVRYFRPRASAKLTSDVEDTGRWPPPEAAPEDYISQREMTQALIAPTFSGPLAGARTRSRPGECSETFRYGGFVSGRCDVAWRV